MGKDILTQIGNTGEEMTNIHIWCGFWIAVYQVEKGKGHSMQGAWHKYVMFKDEY